MFAYCFNNPINLIDPTGEAVLVDDLLIAAAITLVIIAGVYTAASSYSTDGSSALAPDLGGPNLYRLDPGRLPSFGKQKLPDIIPDPAPETPKPKKPNALFYPVLLNKPGITVIFSLPLSVNDAIEDVSNGRNVWTETELAARELTIYVGGDYQSGNNELLVRQGKNAFHYHFPGKKLNGKRNGAHIFYGWQAVEAISRC